MREKQEKNLPLILIIEKINDKTMRRHGFYCAKISLEILKYIRIIMGGKLYYISIMNVHKWFYGRIIKGIAMSKGVK